MVTKSLMEITIDFVKRPCEDLIISIIVVVIFIIYNFLLNQATHETDIPFPESLEVVLVTHVALEADPLMYWLLDRTPFGKASLIMMSTDFLRLVDLPTRVVLFVFECSVFIRSHPRISVVEFGMLLGSSIKRTVKCLKRFISIFDIERSPSNCWNLLWRLISSRFLMSRLRVRRKTAGLTT